MGFKTDSSFVDAWLSKMETAIENNASLVALATLRSISWWSTRQLRLL
jgi:hypothetical protein